MEDSLAVLSQRLEYIGKTADSAKISSEGRTAKLAEIQTKYEELVAENENRAELLKKRFFQWAAKTANGESFRSSCRRRSRSSAAGKKTADTDNQKTGHCHSQKTEAGKFFRRGKEPFESHNKNDVIFLTGRFSGQIFKQ